ncbi:MAG: GntG family PLP-dependent aldolase [Halobacteriales archaeon]|nr:GntG family PLP-dependent aldolase [Halobacteriales archaeon]
MIDLRSDTVTKPNDAMRDAAATAEVGDDVYGEDPTVNELQRRAAELVGKEAALYCPTGTMANQAAIRTHTERGQEVLVDEKSHVFNYEVGGLAQLSSLQVRSFDAGSEAVPTPEQIHHHYHEQSDHVAGTGLVCLENTHNKRGGVAVAPEDIDAAAEAAHELGVPVHLDGARVCNAAVAHDVPVERVTENIDSVMFCLSKGLGAPVGSMIAGSEEFIDRAHRNRKLFGGGMRQAGIIAAPGIEALGNVDRLHEDHENAKRLAAGLDAIDGLSVDEPDTNIVLVETEGTGLTAEAFLEACGEHDILGNPFGEYTVRFCTHWDVSAEDVEATIDGVAAALAE